MNDSLFAKVAANKQSTEETDGFQKGGAFMFSIPGFTRAELKAIFERRGLIPPTPKQLHYWAQSGLIDVVMVNARTPLYSFQTLLDLMVISELLAAGISLQRIRKALAYLEENCGWKTEGLTLKSYELITDGQDIYKPENLLEVMSLLKRPGQLFWRAFVLPAEQIVRETTKVVTESGWQARLLENERHYLAYAV